jgi:hypothetical protein
MQDSVYGTQGRHFPPQIPRQGAYLDAAIAGAAMWAQQGGIPEKTLVQLLKLAVSWVTLVLRGMKGWEVLRAAQPDTDLQCMQL